MNLKVAGFDWDGGNLEKCRKHGVSLREIEDVFLRGVARVAPDWKHSASEDRMIAIGKTLDGRHVFIAFTFRAKSGKKFIRPVSARYMHAREVKAYEEQE